MINFRYGGRGGTRHRLDERKDLVVVRARRTLSLARLSLSRRARELALRLEPFAQFPDAAVEVYRCGQDVARGS